LKVHFANIALEGIFGPVKEKVIGLWRKLHNEKLHNVFIVMVILKRIGWARHEART